MGSLYDAVLVSSRLMQARDTLRNLWRDTWPIEPVRKAKATLQEMATATGKPVLEVAMKAAQRASDHGNGDAAVMILAAYVEIVDPTPVKADPKP